MEFEKLHIGTCSWKYSSWEGLVYSKAKPENFLSEYSSHFNTVEVDQWFWSLFAGGKVVLPKASVIQEYAESVPDGFKFGIKIPNSITLTHYYKKSKSDPLHPNPHFLSVDLMEKFLKSIEPLGEKVGPLMFQFEYLNKQKMPGGLKQFIDQVGEFTERLPDGHDYCIETRNPNFIDGKYFDFLQGQGLHHVFLQGYYMPSIFELYVKHRDQLGSLVVIRLHGPDRQEIEKLTGKDWSRAVAPKDRELEKLSRMLADLKSQQVETFLFVNNHFEGSAPRTIVRIEESLF